MARLRGMTGWCCRVAAVVVIAVLGGSAEAAPSSEQVIPDWAAATAGDQELQVVTSGSSAEFLAAEVPGHPITRARAAGRVSVLVSLDDPAARQAVRSFAAQSGGRVKHEYRKVLPSVLNLRDIPEGKLKALRRIPGVGEVTLDEFHTNLVRLHDSTPLIRGLQSQITGAGLSANGAGVRVCVCDTGIDTDHAMYSSRIDLSASYDFHNNDPNPEDDNGHGSHVSGIAVGGTGLSWDPCGTGSVPFQGVAPEATLIGAKILNSGGGGFDSNIIAGIDHCADQSPSGGRADVINLSIGIGQFSGPCTHSWAVAANNAVANGVVVVAASGNENFSNALSSPACGADVMAIGMTWKANYPTCEDNVTNWIWGICNDFGPQTDEVGCFSNESDYLDVTAPGANIWSASIAAGGGSVTGNSGTSMSSPQVAGLAALILDLDPTLTPAQVRQLIRDGAIDMGPVGFDRAYGWGRIDVIDTLNLVGPGCSVPADCDDGLACNGEEDCVSGSCVAGTPVDCDDSVACTVDSCQEPSGACSNTPDDNLCDDSDSCTSDSCDGGSGCSYTPIAPCCGDGTCELGEDCNSCSADCISGSTGGAVCGNDLCEAGDGEDCVLCPEDCNGKQNGRPSGRFCCGDGDGQGPLPCSDSACSAGGWSCTDVPSGGSAYCCGDGTCEGNEDETNCAVDCSVTCGSDPECDDGLACNGSETCVASACQAGTPMDCDDAVACTVDSCQEPSGVCSNTPDDNLCDDGDSCTSDSCDGVSDCSNDPITACGPADGCCPSGCGSDPDCCLPKRASCTADAECCSGVCRNNGRCR